MKAGRRQGDGKEKAGRSTVEEGKKKARRRQGEGKVKGR